MRIALRRTCWETCCCLRDGNFSRHRFLGGWRANVPANHVKGKKSKTEKEPAGCVEVKVAHRPFGKNHVFAKFNTTCWAKKTRKAPQQGALLGQVLLTLASCYSCCAHFVLSANSKCTVMTERACWGLAKGCTMEKPHDWLVTQANWWQLASFGHCPADSVLWACG